MSRTVPLALFACAALACRADSGPLPRFVEEPILEAPPGVPLARILHVRTDRPTRLSLAWGGRGWTPPERARVHAVPILGLVADRSWTLAITAVDAAGRSRTRALQFETEPLVDPPVFEALVHDPARMEPGLTLLSLQSRDIEGTRLVLVDADLQVVWIQWVPEPVGTVRMGREGHLWGITRGVAFERDLLGNVLRRWVDVPELDGDVAWGGSAMHYDVLPAGADGFVSLNVEGIDVDDYPADYDRPEVGGGPARIRDALVVEVGFDGTERRSWPLSERLDTMRIGWHALGWHDDATGYDWAHANGLARDPTDGGLLVSLRHQDAVIKLSAAGDLEWILGDHAGWAHHGAYLLEPVGPGFGWPYHQHAPMVSPGGDVLLFDNGNRRYTPYDVPDTTGAPVSRVVAYRVDASAREVEQLWAFTDTATGPLYTPVMGDADWLPRTGNVLAAWAAARGEPGAGKCTRVVEFHPEAGEPVLDVRIVAAGDPTRCWWSARAVRVPDLYPW